MKIRPGSSTKVVTEIDPAKDKIRVGASTVYEIKGSTVVLAQTDPPIPRSMLNGQVTVTYLVKEKGDMVRYGFTARVTEFIEYSLSSGRPVKAVVVDKTGDPAPYSIRMFYRVAPTARSRLNMSVLGTRVSVLDISLGGARFSFRKPLVLQSNSVVAVRLEIDGRFHSLDALILRIWTGESQGFSGRLNFASAEFVEINKSVEHALSRKIHDIEREALTKGTLR
jgi:hypothetical protein